MAQRAIEFDPRPITLVGDHVRLEPLGLYHARDLFEAARGEGIWDYLPVATPANTSEMETFVREALQLRDAGTSVPFAIIAAAEGVAVGSTRYLDIQPANRGLEIGWTWLGTDYQRTSVNTECKLLLLAHAFEALGAIRVQLKTDALNLRSQAAIERIGAKKEGVLRNHMIVQEGRYRDSVFYSIVESDWPQVRETLRRMLGKDL